MAPRSVLVAALLAAACATPEPALPGDQSADAAPERITFALAADVTAAELATVVGAMDRWNAAACLDLAIADQGAHRVVFTNDGFSSEERWGQITGGWDRSTIRVRTEMMVSTSRGPFNQVQEDDQRQVLAHEIGHLLTMSNAHSEHGLMSDWASEDVIDEALLERVCSKRDCGCFNPES